MIHPQYQAQVSDMQKVFSMQAPKYVVLDEFLQKDELKRIEALLKKAKRKEQYIPDQYRYHQVFAKDIIKFFETDSALRSFMGMILGKVIKEIKINILELSAQDYSVLHDKNKEAGSAEFLLFFSEWDAAYGGARMLIKDDEKIPVVSKRNRFVLFEKKGVQSYWQYMNHKAGKNKIVVIQGIIK